MSKSTLRQCANGHEYRKSSDCPVCPLCESKREPDAEFMKLVAAPARRALEHAGITSLNALSNWSEAELAELHGMGPNAIGKLKVALQQEGLLFRS
jgi:predicted RecB family nuclease